jgi:hypothetical protein
VIIRISDANGGPERQNELRTGMNGKYNDINRLTRMSAWKLCSELQGDSTCDDAGL